MTRTFPKTADRGNIKKNFPADLFMSFVRVWKLFLLLYYFLRNIFCDMRFHEDVSRCRGFSSNKGILNQKYFSRIRNRKIVYHVFKKEFI